MKPLRLKFFQNRQMTTSPVDGSVDDLMAIDEQLADAKPLEIVSRQIRQSQLRPGPDRDDSARPRRPRPALGQRPSELRTDPATGGVTVQLLPQFDTITKESCGAGSRSSDTCREQGGFIGDRHG